MNARSIKVIFFDAAGTLFHVKGSVGEIYLRYAQKYGVNSSPDAIQAVNSAFKEAFRKAPPPIFAVEHPEKLKQCERLWWFDIVHAVFYRVGMFDGFDEYFDGVYEAFGGPEPWALYPETLGVLGELRNEGYELGIISNFDTRFFPILRGLGLDHYFHSVTLSSLAGSAKPAPKIFQYALEHHVVDPDEAVHVGDSLDEDISGAKSANVIGVYLNREGEPSPENTLAIRSLSELSEVLAKL